MANDDDLLLALRRSQRYRTAIWVTRLANLIVLPTVAWGLAASVGIVRDLPDRQSTLLWVAGATTMLAAVALFYRAGIGAHIARSSQETGNAILRDVFGPRP